ncbi:MAG: sterol desaturase family protein [Gammaproteobacteria bacterium]|nr:sterol desaturase family protein [Gammaproteobacteria bacterium]
MTGAPIEAALEAYRDPLFWAFPVATVLIGMAAFLLFAGPMTWIAARNPAALRARKIQNRKEREGVIGPSIRSWLVNNAWMLLGVVAAWPLIRLTPIHGGPWPAWHEVAWQRLLFVYLDDFLYYWMHRTLHTRWLFRHVHGRHHRIYTPWAITGHYMHPVEYVLTGTLAMVGPALVGAHYATLWVWIAFRQWEAAEGHCGYDFRWSPTRWLPGSDGAIHHDFHHARVKGNFAGFLAIWDRAFGTLVRDYEQDRDRIRQARKAA